MGDLKGKVAVGEDARGSKNLFFSGRNNLRAGCGVPCASDLYGMASHDCELVSTEIGELNCPHRGWWTRSFRV
jgi:hypothetical protein